VVLAHAAQLLRHDQAEEASLGERLEVLARIDELLVALDRVLAHRVWQRSISVFCSFFCSSVNSHCGSNS
jgi:hypothetical protein